MVVDRKFQLEIMYINNAKCDYEETAALIEQKEVFYLRSNGIAQDNAQKMIMHSFSITRMEAINYDAVHNTVLVGAYLQ
ncbi:ABC-type transport system involved in Fe-S cluster assembly, permease component [secondary endosymbiont of Ctenarytaina eucalypti]|uniref:ABC-type transport system involved in Fe-S cluster assembly, permease component n=2 Tax=secondary endosymbiont of Ctenarytaina eucalypti TaxID=1199245 RepID=J3YRJ6_9ENTR|nr:ABC-type transport system involved in Fe-S cluster assembly, permease component [secondary endosymbiont of Ctenarytaina eucalypti]